MGTPTPNRYNVWRSERTMRDDLKDHPGASPELSLRTRASNLEQMGRKRFDLAVIGGGITGAGIALDAASRGLSVALIEKRDFASGTSSRSSKLIHGGLRYLAQIQFGMVKESLRERALLMRMAPHLSKPLRFLIPVYSSSAKSPLGSNRLKLAAGLWIYDLLAGRLNIERHRWLSPEDALALAPALEPSGLRGAFLYNDCLTDDARLVIEVIKEAAARGALAANYASLRGFRKDKGRITAAEVQETVSGASFELSARFFVNATGVWSDDISRMSDPDVSKKLRPSKGIHIVTPREKIRNRIAVLIPSLGERRFLFVIPWHGRTLIGTTDADYDGELDEPRAEADEIARVLESAAAAFPAARLSTQDVISSFAGLRPLVAAQAQSTAELSRGEAIFEDQTGLISITGGKLTTWRRMAERVVDRAVQKLERDSPARLSPMKRCITERIELAGGPPDGELREESARAAVEFGVSPRTAEHLIETYGGNYRIILELAGEADELKRRLVDELPHIEAEALYAARYEMAVTVEDFLSRRTRIQLLARDHGRASEMRVKSLLERGQSIR